MNFLLVYSQIIVSIIIYCSSIKRSRSLSSGICIGFYCLLCVCGGVYVYTQVHGWEDPIQPQLYMQSSRLFMSLCHFPYFFNL